MQMYHWPEKDKETLEIHSGFEKKPAIVERPVYYLRIVLGGLVMYNKLVAAE